MLIKNHKIVSDKGTFEFYKGLLNMELTKNEFKILTMVLALKNDERIYSGKLANMCEFLNIGKNSKNNKNIKETINDLSEKGLLVYYVNGYTWTLIFKDSALENKEILQLDKAWLDTVRLFRVDKNNSVDWSNLLKVFIFLFTNNNKVFTIEEISKETNLSKDIIKKALAAIREINAAGGFGGGYGSLVIETKKQYEVFSWAQKEDVFKPSEWTGECETKLKQNGSVYRKIYSDEKGFNPKHKHYECIGSTISAGYKFDFK